MTLTKPFANDPTDSVDLLVAGSWNARYLAYSFATIAGKEINLENVQIVNGLQTPQRGNLPPLQLDRGVGNDERAVLVKIVVTENEEVRDRIIKAYQLPESGSNSHRFVRLDRIQRDIEHFLYDHGWYYDRKEKNFYRNQGVPSERIDLDAQIFGELRSSSGSSRSSNGEKTACSLHEKR